MGYLGRARYLIATGDRSALPGRRWRARRRARELTHWQQQNQPFNVVYGYGVAPAPGPYRPPRRRRNRGVPLVATILVILLVALGAQNLLSDASYAEPAPAPSLSSSALTGQRLLPEVPVTTDGKYVFNATDSAGAPVRFDPCRVISWVYNPSGAPPNTEVLVREAVDDVSAHTGLAFAYAGTTNEFYTFEDELPSGQVVISWSNESETEDLGGDVAGLGGAVQARRSDGQTRYDSGQIVLDAPDLVDLLEQRNGPDEVRLVIMHELGHVVGLDHTDDPTELMYAESRSQKGWGPGDLKGLALLGHGGCLT